MKFCSRNEADTVDLGKKLGRRAKIGEVYCLDGDLGAGKTVFSKGFADGLGIADKHITSPTYTFLNEYEGSLPLYHFDAYRLKGAEDAICFDFEEYFERGVCLIEWAENISKILPRDAFRIRIEKIAGTDNEREITVQRCVEGGETKNTEGIIK